MDLVSVWIGDFPSEDAFNEYLEEDYSAAGEDDFPACRFWDDLGIRWHDHDFQEAVFRPEPLPVGDLVAGVSWVESYKADLLRRCRDLGISRANAAVVIYEYDYAPPEPFASPHLRFVGSFRYSTGGYPFRRDPP
jgi:Immunity protein 22